MPVITSCSKCKKHYRVPDTTIGKRVQCAQCRHQFTAEIAPPPVAVHARSRSVSSTSWIVTDQKTRDERAPVLVQSPHTKVVLIPALIGGLVLLAASLSLGLKITVPHSKWLSSHADQEPIFDVNEEHLKQAEREAIPVSIHQLVEDYKNEVYGTEKYGGKKLKITGLIGKGIGESVVLWSKASNGLGVLCDSLDWRDVFKKAYGEDQLDPTGIEAAIVAKCYGQYASQHAYGYELVLILSECVFLTPVSEMERLVKERDALQRQYEEAKKKTQLAAWIEREEQVRKNPAVRAGVMWADFRDNDTFRTYKVVEVTGIVNRVRHLGANSSFPFDIFEVELQIPGADYTITAAFRSQADVVRLKPGEEITLRGHPEAKEFFGPQYTTALRDCSIVHNKP